MAYIIEQLSEPPIDVFVPDDKQQEYLERFGIQVDYLTNGSTIVSRFSKNRYSVNSELQLFFPTGSYFDPEGKEGLLHFMEHLTANTPLRTALLHESKFNAYTNSEHLRYELEGAANESVRKYGVWPVIPILLQEITNPDIMSYDLEVEKKVIEVEIIEGMGDSRRRLAKAFNRRLFASDHPNNSNVPGTIDSIKSFNFVDIAQARKRALTPKGLYASLYVAGTQAAYNDFRTQIKEAIETMEGPNPQVVTDDLLNRFNTEIVPGSKFVDDIDLKNGTIDMNYIWLFPYRTWTSEAIAVNQMAGLIQRRLHEHSRRMGLSYSTGLHNFVKGWTRAIGFNLTVPKVADVEGLANLVFEGIKKSVLDNIDDGQISDAVELHNLRQRALPLTLDRRMDDAARGLKYYGHIIDSDKARKFREVITVEDLKMWRERLLETQPSTIIMGDLS